MTIRRIKRLANLNAGLILILMATCAFSIFTARPRHLALSLFLLLAPAITAIILDVKLRRAIKRRTPLRPRFPFFHKADLFFVGRCLLVILGFIVLTITEALILRWLEFPHETHIIAIILLALNLLLVFMLRKELFKL